jgi:hypothetical protein
LLTIKSVKSLILLKDQNVIAKISRIKIKAAAGAVGTDAASSYSSGSNSTKMMQLLLYYTEKKIIKGVDEC